MACLKSGAIKESANLVRVEPITGPGMCGAEYPLKVAALGDASAIGYSEPIRPPGGIPELIARQQPRWPVQQQTYAAPPPVPAMARGASVAPMTLNPPGVAANEADYDVPDEADAAPRSRASSRVPAEAGYEQRAPLNASPLPRLGPSQSSPVGAIGPVVMKPAATLACPIVSTLDKWIAESVQPAAARWFGIQVAEIRQISAYSCRGMNGNSRSQISEHAFGNALDISAFVLADGRRVSVKDGWKGLPEEQGFLRDVQAGACAEFNTVLAPGSNVYHYDHIHVDLMRRASGRVICQPAAVSGEQIASRASQRGGYAGRDPSTTGSIGRGNRVYARGPLSREDRETIEDETRISDRGR